MGKLEEMRQKLGITRLDENNQSKMLDEFQKAGGKVVSLKEDEAVLNLKKLREAADERKRYEDDLEERKRRESEERARKDQEKAEAAKKASAGGSVSVQTSEENRKPIAEILGKAIQVRKHRPADDYMQMISSRIMLFFSGIARFFTNRFTNSFINATLLDLKSSLLNSKNILASILHQDVRISREIRDKMTSLGRNYYYELVYRFDAIPDENVFRSISGLKLVGKQIRSGQAPFLQLYRKLYPLYAYRSVMVDALSLSLQTERQMRSIDSTVTDSNIRYMRKQAEFVFNRYYPKLAQLVDYYYKVLLASGKKQTMLEFIRLDESDTIGYWTQKWKQEDEEEENRKKKEEESKNRERGDISDPLANIENMEGALNPVKMGLQFIYDNIDFQEILKDFTEKNDPWALCQVNDRVFLIYCLIDFFDREFSFLFISNQVKFDIFVDKYGAKVDVRARLRDHYFQLEEIYQRARNYVKTMQQLSSITTHQELLDSKSLPEVEHQNSYREEILRIMITDSRKLIEQFEQTLNFMVSDRDVFGKIVGNADEMYHFDEKMQEKKLRQDTPIYELFLKAWYFVSALYFLLSEGDLSGYGLLVRNQRYLRIGVSEPKLGRQIRDEGQSSRFYNESEAVEEEIRELKSIIDRAKSGSSNS
jgi:hypothetical protein